MTISTTIKAIYLDKIETGEKTMELKGATKYWWIRLQPLVGPHIDDDLDIIFICGRRIVRYDVTAVIYEPAPMDIDGVRYAAHYGILLGERLRWPRIENRG